LQVPRASVDAGSGPLQAQDFEPVRSCNPRLGRFDSGAAPSSRKRRKTGGSAPPGYPPLETGMVLEAAWGRLERCPTVARMWRRKGRTECGCNALPASGGAPFASALQPTQRFSSDYDERNRDELCCGGDHDE
jgi:hypothetical protein